MSDNIKETVAKNLLYYRKKNKITQKELAEKLGVKHNAISSWENGVNSIDIDTLFQICKIFGISVNDMYASPFHQLSSLKNIDVSKFDTAKIVSIENLFSTLKDLSIENLNKVNIYVENLLTNQQMEEALTVQAAHGRTDIKVTDEMSQNDDDIMDDKNF